jgi:hypothetical protein
MPAIWELINSVRTADGLQQRLVVIPAQYRALNDQTGVERRFEEILYTVYYSTSRDTTPPSIWTVRNLSGGSHFTVEVEATDFSGVRRTVVAYTSGDGVWQTADMARDPGDEDFWTATLPLTPTVEYFVQAVDEAGNVAVSDNKGRYFKFEPYIFYLPIMFKGA